MGFFNENLFLRIIWVPSVLRIESNVVLLDGCEVPWSATIPLLSGHIVMPCSVVFVLRLIIGSDFLEENSIFGEHAVMLCGSCVLL